MSPVIVRDETHWSPDDDCTGATVTFAQSATSDVKVNAYGFTSVPLMDTLLSLHAKGVKVQCLCDHTQAAGPAEHQQLLRLVNAGIEVVITTSRTGAIDHEKVIIVDGDLGPMASTSAVLFGSFNFSASAQQQDNYISIRSDAGLVAKFLANWQEIYAQPRHDAWQLEPAG